MDLKEKVSKYEIDEAQIVYSYLKNSKCKYAIIPDEWINANNKTSNVD